MEPENQSIDSSNIINNQDSIAKINKQLINSVGRQIQTSRLTISNQSVSISNILQKQKHKQKNKSFEESFDERKLNEIIHKKRELQTQLKRLQLDESRIKEKRPHCMAEGEQGKTKYFRSTITEEQKKKIKEVIKQTKKFEQQNEKKTQNLMRKIQLLKQEEKQEHEKKKREFSEKKKQQAKQNIEHLKQFQSSRAENIAETNREIKKIKQQKFLHQIIDEKWKIVEATEQEENEKIKAKKAKEKKLDHQEIMAHSRRYSEIMLQNKLKREENNVRFHQQLQLKEKLQKHKQSTFFKTISEEEKHRKQIMEQKMMTSHIFMTKRALYADTVREKLKHKSDKSPKNQGKIKQESLNDKRTKSLDYFSLYKLGNDYMKQVNANIGYEEQSKSRQNQNPESFKYHDYLTEARNKRSLQESEVKPISQQMRELKKLFNEKSSSEKNDGSRDRLLKAKSLAKRLDEKAHDKNCNTKTLVDSIAAKISILEEFS